MLMVDLFAGLGGASRAMRDRGWRVVAVDNLGWLNPTVVADVRSLPFDWSRLTVDLAWASPPCTEYSRRYLRCFYPDAAEPDLTLWHAARAAIREIGPRWWVLENVQGAVRYWGRPDFRYGSRLLWTNIPLLPQLPRLKGKMAIAGNRKRSVRGQDPLAYWKRSEIPYPLSEAIAITVEGLVGVSVGGERALAGEGAR